MGFHDTVYVTGDLNPKDSKENDGTQCSQDEVEPGVCFVEKSGDRLPSPKKL